MQNALSNLPTELIILETLVDEQHNQSNRHVLPVKTMDKLRDYVKAQEALLILFDSENPDSADKKLLGDTPTWKSETTFFKKESVFCNSIPEKIAWLDHHGMSEMEPAILDDIAVPVQSMILAPLNVDRISLGAILFINPEFDIHNERQSGFLQLAVNGFANAIYAEEQHRQLIIRKAELELTHWQIVNSRNTLRTFFDNIPSSVYIVDRSYNIMAVNRVRSDKANKAPQDLVNEKCYAVFRGLPTPCPDCQVMDALNGIPSVRTSRELGSNETFLQWEITTIPIRENPDVINQVIIFEEDVTEKWILEANLIQAEKMASIGQLAANVAHEINNPLAAIIANAQLLMRDLSDADEDTIDSLKLIETAGDRAAKIVTNLLESARREKHHEFEEISLNETIMDAVSLLRYEINQRSISLHLDLAKNIPYIFANKNQLKGVWINLLNNALGAIDSTQGRISISTRYESKVFTVVFADNGKGILQEHRNRIFEPFFTTKEAGKGTGLGLSVSLQAIKEHHGSIDFETEPGAGTKFIVVLPDIDGDSY